MTLERQSPDERLFHKRGWATLRQRSQITAGNVLVKQKIVTLTLAILVSLMSEMIAGSALAADPFGFPRTWGGNYRGQLCSGSTSPSTNPAPSPITFMDAVAIAGGNNSTYIVKADGTLWACGANESGQLGDGTTTDSSQPVRVKTGVSCATNLTGVSRVAGAGGHAVALKTDGTVWAWGDNAAGELGDATNTIRLCAVQVKTSSAGTSNLAGVTAVAAGFESTIALKSDGTVWAWGDNSQGQLGDAASPTDKNFAVQVLADNNSSITNLTSIVSIASGSHHNVASKADGTVWAWGDNYSGQLGNADTPNDKDYAFQVRTNGSGAPAYLGGATTVGAGWNHSLALRSTGTVTGWGDNHKGELGDNNAPNDASYASTNVRSSPAGAPLSGVTAIVGAGHHSLAILAGGSVVAWGRSDHGELGPAAYGDANFRAWATTVPGITASIIGGGGDHSLALGPPSVGQPSLVSDEAFLGRVKYTVLEQFGITSSEVFTSISYHQDLSSRDLDQAKSAVEYCYDSPFPGWHTVSCRKDLTGGGPDIVSIDIWGEFDMPGPGPYFEQHAQYKAWRGSPEPYEVTCELTKGSLPQTWETECRASREKLY